MISLDRIVSIETKKAEIAAAMAAGDLPPEEFVRMSKEYAQIEPVAAARGTANRLSPSVMSSRTAQIGLAGLIWDPLGPRRLGRREAATRHPGVQPPLDHW